MAFNFLTFLRRLSYIVLTIVIVVIWLIVCAFVGGRYGDIYGFLIYLSPGILAFFYLLGLK
jgi:hypothetical protein